MPAIQFLLTGCVARFTSFDSIRKSLWQTVTAKEKKKQQQTNHARKTKMDFAIYKIQIKNTIVMAMCVYMHQFSMLNNKIECENVFNGEYVLNVCFLCLYDFFSVSASNETILHFAINLTSIAISIHQRTHICRMFNSRIGTAEKWIKCVIKTKKQIERKKKWCAFFFILSLSLVFIRTW